VGSKLSKTCLMTVKKKKKNRVSLGFGRADRVSDRPARPTGFSWVNFRAGFYLNPDRFQARVGQIPG
jgi:hypothetical protein